MRRLLGILLFFLMVFVLSACDKSSLEKNTISSANLSEMDTAIIATTMDNTFVYKYHTNGKDHKLSVWIEKYKKGKLVDDQLAHLTSAVKNNGFIIFAIQKENNETSPIRFNIGINSGQNTLTTNGLDNDAENLLGFKGRFQGVKKIGNGEMVLGGIYDSKDEIHSMSNFYENANKMKKYDVVYLFKAKFID